MSTMKERLLVALKKRVGNRASVTLLKPGRGWTIKREGDMVWFGARHVVDSHTRRSHAKKTWSLASTDGPYSLADYGLPDHFVIAYLCKWIPVSDSVDIEAILEDIEEDEDEA
jgi:hypothetical protein